MLCIFLTLTFQLVVTIITMQYDKEKQTLGNQSFLKFILLFLFLILIIFLMIGTNLPFFIKQFLFIIFSIFFGLLLSQSVYIINDPTIVETAAISTLINFVVMFIAGLFIVYMGYDISWMGIYLFIILLILITIQIIRIFSPMSSMINKTIAIITVILFSIFILYDTNNILLKYNGNNDCIRGALDYYLDIINLFTSYLNLGN